jgi:hypothetical protein
MPFMEVTVTFKADGPNISAAHEAVIREAEFQNSVVAVVSSGVKAACVKAGLSDDFNITGDIVSVTHDLPEELVEGAIEKKTEAPKK